MTRRFGQVGLVALALAGLSVQSAFAAPPQMHIMEGFLPLLWAIFWWLVALPFLVFGFRSIRRIMRDHPDRKMLLALAGAFIFVLSALKLPSVTGSSSHPTGTGLAAILFGPLVTGALGSIALLFQAILLAHGGITTLGANAFSMAIAGPILGWTIFRSAQRIHAPDWLSVFLAAAIADLFTYVVTSLQLALAFPDALGGIWASFVKFAAIFAVTQVPLAISEGILTVVIINALSSLAQGELLELGLLRREARA